MRKNVKNLAKCGIESYVKCRKCDKRKLTPKCEFLKRAKKVKTIEEVKSMEGG